MRVAVLAAVLLAWLAGSAGARDAKKGPCTRAAANAAVRSSTLRSDVKELTRQPMAGVDRIICHDLTGDQRLDMAVTLASGGTAGDIAWAAFQRAGKGWRLVASNADAYKVDLHRAGADLIESQPVYRRTDPNCCPTGGFDHRRFHWNGTRLAAIRVWHDRKPRL